MTAKELLGTDPAWLKPSNASHTYIEPRVERLEACLVHMAERLEKAGQWDWLTKPPCWK